jgi:hypothetical protein
LEAALAKQPFMPFEIRTDGEVITVRHPEQVLLAAQKTTVVIDAVDRIHIVDAAQISKLTLLRRSRAKSGVKTG